MKRFLIRAILCGLGYLSSISAQGSGNENLDSRGGDPESLVQNVSVIHGDYSEVETDIVVPAPDSLTLTRFYSSRDSLQRGRFGGWRFTPHCYLLFDKAELEVASETEKTFQRVYAHAGDVQGSAYIYEGWATPETNTEQITFRIDPQGESAGICNTAAGGLSAWTNTKNNILKYDPQKDRFELLLASMGKRFYEKAAADQLYVLIHEILPSGNRIFYEYDSEGRLTWIRESNALEDKLLAWIHIEYGKGIHVETSDGKWVDYFFEQLSPGIQVLASVKRFGKPAIEYRYKMGKKFPLLVRKDLPEDRYLEVDYQFDEDKPKVQSVSIPLNQQEDSKWQFSYGDDFTEVQGPCQQKTIYRFDDDLRLTAREQYLHGELYRTYKKQWGKGANCGNFIAAFLKDADGGIYHYKHFCYDNKGNVIEEREYGDFSGKGHVALVIDEDRYAVNAQGKIRKTNYFSDDQFDGFFQEDTSGGGVKCWYQKGTNLLIKKVHTTKVSLETTEEDYFVFKRAFYEYNEDAALKKISTDDGRPCLVFTYGKEVVTPSRGNITLITPKKELPNIGAPEVVEDKAFFQPFYSYRPLRAVQIKKTINRFDPYGNIISKDLYDAEDSYQYSTGFSYSNGLLVSLDSVVIRFLPR